MASPADRDLTTPTTGGPTPMQVKILKPFPYSEDGIRIRNLAVGAVEEIHADLVPGLRGEGCVEDVEATDPAASGDADAAAGPAEVEPAAPEPVAAGAAEVEVAPAIADARPQLSPAQEAALDRDPRDGVTKPGGSPKGGNRRRAG